MKITDFMNVDEFINLVVQKLHSYPSTDCIVKDSKGDKYLCSFYYSEPTIKKAIRSILSPTKAKQWNETTQR